MIKNLSDFNYSRIHFGGVFGGGGGRNKNIDVREQYYNHILKYEQTFLECARVRAQTKRLRNKKQMTGFAREKIETSNNNKAYRLFYVFRSSTLIQRFLRRASFVSTTVQKSD